MESLRDVRFDLLDLDTRGECDFHSLGDLR